jgi:hypothetical protein
MSLESKVVAVVLVVESSLAVAAEWPRIIRDYVVHMLKRLTDLNPAHRVRNFVWSPHDPCAY